MSFNLYTAEYTLSNPVLIDNINLTKEYYFVGDRTIYSGGNGIQTDLNTSFGAYGRYTDNTAQFTCPNVERDLYT